jgi:5-methylcytosine-specific restriction endonuclease McrA
LVAFKEHRLVALRRKGAREVSKITRKSLLELIQGQGFKCALTGRELEPDFASVDHKIPISAGGQHSMENLWVLHADVNRAKNTMDVDQFVSMCREVVAHYGAK